jgi:RNA polymerase sigma-70 factor (ECF subfamily)
MAKRLVRAKAKIGAAAIPYRVPPPELLPERTPGVLSVLYLLFNEGYSASSGDALIRAALCDEAIRLARLLRRLMPDEPEAEALLALMLLQHSRRDARVDAQGDLITLEHQDRGLWHSDEIGEANGILAATGPLAGGGALPGTYRLQAEIAACHVQPQTDWARVRDLYEHLAQTTESPVVQLNLAVAVAMAGDLDAGLALVGELVKRDQLDSYHLLHATLADLLRRRGDLEQARAAYERALALAPSAAERRFLRARIEQLTT